MADVQRNLEPKNRDKFTQVRETLMSRCHCTQLRPRTPCPTVGARCICALAARLRTDPKYVFIELVRVPLQNLTLVRTEFRSKA